MIFEKKDANMIGINELLKEEEIISYYSPI